MPDSKSFSQLTTAESLDIRDLYALSKTDTNAESGYVSRSASFSTIANAIVNSVEFAELITENNTIVGAINEILTKTDITLTFSDGYSNSQNIDYYLYKQNNEVKFKLALTNTAGISDGVTIATLPSSYLPQSVSYYPATIISSTTPSYIQSCIVGVDTDGNIKAYTESASAVGDTLIFDGMFNLAQISLQEGV